MSSFLEQFSTGTSEAAVADNLIAEPASLRVFTRHLGTFFRHPRTFFRWASAFLSWDLIWRKQADLSRGKFSVNSLDLLYVFPAATTVYARLLSSFQFFLKYVHTSAGSSSLYPPAFEEAISLHYMRASDNVDLAVFWTKIP
jgi:hypothetical protein